MTATAQIPEQASTVAAIDRLRVRAGSDAVAFSITLVVLLALFLPLQNPYWVPGGDSEVYTSVARSIVLGQGYKFNGQPVLMIPPGWSIVLAGLMKISPTFALLKLATMLCMFGSLAITYWICRRFTSPVQSALVVSLTAIVSHVYSLTFWLHSDACFCLLSSIAILLAMQIREGRDSKLRFASLIVVCCACVAVRWVGLGTSFLCAAVLLEGESRRRMLLGALVACMATLTTFIGIRWAISVSPEVQKQIRDSGASAEETPNVTAAKVDANVAMSYPIFNPEDKSVARYIARAGRWGNWLAYLLWQPLRMGHSSFVLGMVSLLAGTMALVPLLITGWRGLMMRRWFWPAVLLYMFALALRWPQPTSRYLVPLAPFIILGVLQGLQAIRGKFSNPTYRRTCTILAGYFIAAILLCNGPLWAVDVYVARSKDFYASYEAGLNRDLIAAASWLRTSPANDGEIAISERYVNLGRVLTSRVSLRATSLLTGKAIVSINPRFLRSGDPHRNGNFLAEMRRSNIKYFLYQPDVSPWRLFHFRVAWLQELMTNQPATDTHAGWRLYEIPAQGDARRIQIDTINDSPTRVPGL